MQTDEASLKEKVTSYKVTYNTLIFVSLWTDMLEKFQINELFPPPPPFLLFNILPQLIQHLSTT